MTKNCLMCSEAIKKSAFKCPNCGSLQLKYRWIQPAYWCAISVAAILPLIIIALNMIESIEPDDVNIEFLSDTPGKKEMNFLVQNSSGKEAVIYAAFYEEKNDKSYSEVELTPTVIKGNSYKIVHAKLNEHTAKPGILSTFKAVAKSKTEGVGTIEKVKHWWNNYEPEEWWADEDTCTFHFLINAGEREVKSVNFKCMKS
ncbi:hypothetical protein [Salinivibrio kushneri]|uniref:hypothetical protein n=1 Tax=Salinivibrio kushneri TaxID=1908198 RepID=UPI0022B59C0B|nr:hypothetical protein [Salinivibrio kushneri]WBA12612.1 hypothetical protein O4546_05240 [Salinivibrio kushneri]